MNNIIWLASYPKSGNTWFRIFLSNLLQPENAPADINDLESTPIASARGIFDTITGFNAADLSHDESDRFRPEVYEHLSSNAEDIQFQKVHDAFTYLDDGSALLSKKATRGAIYFIRNPLDVAISYANHSGIPIDKSIEQINDPDHAFCYKSKQLHNQLRQKLLTWSQHVESWVDHSGIDVHVMRYEDMKNNPLKTFSGAVDFAGLEKTDAEIQQALKHSDFKEIQKQEQEKGFHEKAPDCQAFFKKGECGYWREVLNEDQVKQIIDAHATIMKRFGYLDKNSNPI